MDQPTVKLIGEDGNAFSVLGKVCKALRKSGAEEKTIDKYMKEAMKSDYDNLLTVTMKYVNVE